MDPRIARIKAAARMPLPRLAADALADALRLLDAYEAEIKRLREAAPPPPVIVQAPRGDTAELVQMRLRLDRANAARDKANASAVELLGELDRVKAELAWHRAPVIQHCKRCGAENSDGKTCRKCRLDQHPHLKTYCACGAPKHRSGAASCRKCYLARVVIPRAPRPTTPGCCKDCNAVLPPGRTVCPKCAKQRHIAKHGRPCMDCGGRCGDVDSVRCQACHIKRGRHAE